MTSSRRLVRLLAAMLAGLCALAAPAAAMAVTGPTVVGATSNNTSLSSVVSVAVSGTTAYTTAAAPTAAQLTAVDFSHPAAPTILGSTPTTPSLENGSNVTIAGHYAFVVAKNRNASTTNNDDGTGNALTIVDIANPSAPVVVGSIRSTTELFGSYGVAVSGNYAFVAYQGLLSGQPTSPDTSQGGFSVIDISNPAGPTIVANIDNPPSSSPWFNAFKHATSVQIAGHYAFVTAFYDQRVTVVDIASPTSPHIVASLRDATNLGAPADLAIQGTHLYVANQTNGVTSPEFTVIDIANPLSPTVLATVSNSMLAGAYRLRVRGDFAYVSGFNSGAVSAIDISDPTHPRFAGGVQDAGHLHRTSGLDLDASGRYVIANSPSLSTDPAGTPYPPFTATNGTISVIDMVPNPIAVTIAPASEPPNPTTQTSANFSFSTNDDVSAVACSLDGAAPGPCTTPTGQTYSGLAVGSHTFTVQATDSSGHTASASDTWVIAAQASAPQNTVRPAITGTATQGQTLIASSGTWSGLPAPSFSYRWERCDSAGAGCAPITGATSQIYTVSRSDLASTLAVVVSATNSQGTTPASSSPTAVVTGPPASTAAPGISGRPLIGNRLTATTGAWTGYPAPALQGQWQRCDGSGQSCQAIGGATGTSYTVSGADLGRTLRFVVRATNSAGSAQAESTPTGKVAVSAKATVHGLKSRHVSIKLSVSTPRAGSALTKLTLSLPKGLSFTRLSSGLHVLSANGHKLRFSAKLVHGVLTITLRAPAASVTVVIDPVSIKESAQLARTAKAKHQKQLALTLTLAGTNGLSARDPLSATVAS